MSLDEANYRFTTTRRGYTYSYYYLPPQQKPHILFLHGFPSTSHDWADQITAFSSKGYGIIAPDMLGYGKTSAPSDYREYKTLDMAKDVIDVLDAAGVDKVLVVGHEWGCLLLSRILNVYIDRFIGAAFLAVGYVPPQPNFHYETRIKEFNQRVGYDVYGFWEFFASDEGPKAIEEHISSFYSLIFPRDALVWRTDLAPRGKAREWIEADRRRPCADYWPNDEQKQRHMNRLLQTGLRGPCNWYKGRIKQLNNADEATIPHSTYIIPIPTFFGGALKNHIYLSKGHQEMMAPFCPKMTVRHFDTSHWIMYDAPQELEERLEGFFNSIPGV